MTTRSDLRAFAEGIDRRLRQPKPDFKGMTDELIGAKRMALALGDHGAADEMTQLHKKVREEWLRNTEAEQ